MDRRERPSGDQPEFHVCRRVHQNMSPTLRYQGILRNTHAVLGKGCTTPVHEVDLIPRETARDCFRQ